MILKWLHKHKNDTDLGCTTNTRYGIAERRKSLKNVLSKRKDSELFIYQLSLFTPHSWGSPCWRILYLFLNSSPYLQASGKSRHAYHSFELLSNTLNIEIEWRVSISEMATYPGDVSWSWISNASRTLRWNFFCSTVKNLELGLFMFLFTFYFLTLEIYIL